MFEQMNAIGTLSQYKMVRSYQITDRIQVRFPRSKKKRIRKKWAKQEKNFAYFPSKNIWKMGDTLIAHPEVIEKIMKEITKDMYRREENRIFGINN